VTEARQEPCGDGNGESEGVAAMAVLGWPRMGGYRWCDRDGVRCFGDGNFVWHALPLKFFFLKARLIDTVLTIRCKQF
jgi:hypothetical protein